MNKLQVWLNRRAAEVLGYGSCEKCGRGWNICKGYGVAHTSSTGSFALCEDCWNNSTVDERVMYWKIAYDKHWTDTGIPFSRYEQAVRRNLQWENYCPQCGYLSEDGSNKCMNKDCGVERWGI